MKEKHRALTLLGKELADRDAKLGDKEADLSQRESECVFVEVRKRGGGAPTEGGV